MTEAEVFTMQNEAVRTTATANSEEDKHTPVMVRHHSTSTIVTILMSRFEAYRNSSPPNNPPIVVGYNPKKVGRYNLQPNPRPKAKSSFRMLGSVTTQNLHQFPNETQTEETTSLLLFNLFSRQLKCKEHRRAADCDNTELKAKLTKKVQYKMKIFKRSIDKTAVNYHFILCKASVSSPFFRLLFLLATGASAHNFPTSTAGLQIVFLCFCHLLFMFHHCRQRTTGLSNSALRDANY